MNRKAKVKYLDTRLLLSKYTKAILPRAEVISMNKIINKHGTEPCQMHVAMNQLRRSTPFQFQT
jgi:predicted DNA-binding protein with PD1-like motif